MKIDVKILDPRLNDNLPAYATPGSAGLDLRACLSEPLTLAANAWQLIPTGMARYLQDPAYAALVINMASCWATWSDSLTATTRAS